MITNEAFYDQLIAFKNSIQKTERGYSYKSPNYMDMEPKFILTRKHLITVLNAFLASVLTPKEVQLWVGLFDFDDNVSYEKGYLTPINTILCNIDYDHDQGDPLTPEKAQEYIHQLETAPFNPEDNDD